jgi:chitosanase
MQISDTQRRIIEAIINVFETGTPKPKYDALYVLNDGAGITFGRAGATDAAGNLDKIVFEYIDAHGKFAEDFRKHLPALAMPSCPLAGDAAFKALLRQAAREDQIMRDVQDSIFDSQYWQPALAKAEKLQLVLPLSMAVVYDSYIQGSFERVRSTFAAVPPCRGGDEKKWTAAYVVARRRWLANFPNTEVQRSVYRMDTFRHMLSENNWDVHAPVVANGIVIV